MIKFRIGNIIKTDDKNIWIVVNETERENYFTKQKDRYYNTVSFTYENSSGGLWETTYINKESCNCENYDENYEYYGNNPECETCKGTGYYNREWQGADRAKLLASNAKEYIIKNLIKKFDF